MAHWTDLAFQIRDVLLKQVSGLFPVSILGRRDGENGGRGGRLQAYKIDSKRIKKRNVIQASSVLLFQYGASDMPLISSCIKKRHIFFI